MDKENIAAIALVVSAIGLFAGVISWWLGKFLADKRDSVAHGIDIEHMKEDIEEMKGDIRDLQRNRW